MSPTGPRIVALVCLPALLAGCSTLFTISKDVPPRNKIYCGTRASLNLWWWMHAGPIALVDLPFTIALDTLLLPYTVPLAIVDATESDDPDPAQEEED